jgi:RNA polymerase sigma-70 factor (ECF subfamily)
MHGDTAAFEEICAAKRRELYITAYTMLGSKEDAEDAVQDTMLNMFRNIGNLRKPKAFNSWIYRILHDCCVNILRKKGRQLRTDPLGDEIIDAVADMDTRVEPEGALTDLEMSAEVYESIRLLPEKSRDTLILYYFGDLKYREIAEMTNTSIKTVSTNLIYAKKVLRERLREYGPGVTSLSAGIPLFGEGAKHILALSSKMAANIAIGAAGVACAAAVTYAALAVPDYAIALSGDCDCGHINPKSIELKGARAGDSPGEWELLARDGSAIFAGSLDSVTDYIQKLEKTRRDGRYKLRCVITSKNGARYAVSRGITIGDFAGDE